MATKSKQQPSQGGGRTANAEPRIQDFKAFQGINIELSPYGDYNYEEQSEKLAEQSDLQQTFFSVLNNAEIKSNGSIQNRERIIDFPQLPSWTDGDGVEWATHFYGPALQVGRRIFAATVTDKKDGHYHGQSPYAGLMYYDLPDNPNQVSAWHECGFNGGSTDIVTYNFGPSNRCKITVAPHKTRVLDSITMIHSYSYSDTGGSLTASEYFWDKKVGAGAWTAITDPRYHHRNILDVVNDNPAAIYRLRIKLSDGTTYTVASDISVTPDDPTLYSWPIVEDICYADDKLIVSDSNLNFMWTCANPKATTPVFTQARYVYNPGAPKTERFTPKNMTMSASYSATTPYKVSFALQYVTQFGPTVVSADKTLYFSKPVSEWNDTYNVTITIPQSSAPGLSRLVLAAEVFYKVDTASEYNFAFRAKTTPEDATTFWTYTWCGYLQDPKSWTVANLTPNDDGNNLSVGPRAKYVDFIDGRFWFWNCYDGAYRIYAGGNPGNLLSVSPTTGGGFVDVDPGTGNQVMLVTKYKTQSGNNIITCLCDNPNTHREQRYNLVETSISLSSEQTQRTWQAEQVAGCVGTSSRWGAIVAEDGIYSMSRYGLALTTMTMEYNSQLRTQYVSDPIKPLFTTRSGETLKAASVECIDGILYIAFGKNPNALGNKYPDIIFCYDIAKKVWWSMSCLWVYGDSSIINTFHLDYEEGCEGLGVVLQDHLLMFPTAHRSDHDDDEPETPVVIKTAQIGTTQPLQNWHRLTQLQFDFDYFFGYAQIEISYLDRFGRKQKVVSTVNTYNSTTHDTDTWYNYSHFVRVDADVRSYTIQILIDGKFRLTHFMSKIYAQTKRYNMPLGFDSALYDVYNDYTLKTERLPFKSYDDYLEYAFDAGKHTRVQIT